MVDIYTKTCNYMTMKGSELMRWLKKQGATITPGKGSHFHVILNGKRSILPIHGKDVPVGTVEAIKKQLGLR